MVVRTWDIGPFGGRCPKGKKKKEKKRRWVSAPKDQEEDEARLAKLRPDWLS
jgi:hypothetical protein